MDPRLLILAIATVMTQSAAQTYLGFVIDDTGSMGTEIPTVKQWIKGCLDSSDEECEADNYLVARFNDPDAKIVAEPTANISAITKAIDSLYPHGGDDCPEMLFGGLEAAIEKVPKDNTGCKIFFFTDATAKDESKFENVSALFTERHCQANPILTGCCGKCADVCTATSSEYCIDHVTDTTPADPSRKKRAADSVGGEKLYYALAESTGGNVLLTEKPRSTTEFAAVLSKSLTLGFCPTNKIAGPLPGGYRCKAQCDAAKMCWDKGLLRCYCNSETDCSTRKIIYPRCPAKITCGPDDKDKNIPDKKSCDKYFLCNSGKVSHEKCPVGKLFQKNSKDSPCDEPQNVAKPCGTRSRYKNIFSSSFMG